MSAGEICARLGKNRNKPGTAGAYCEALAPLAGHEDALAHPAVDRQAHHAAAQAADRFGPRRLLATIFSSLAAIFVLLSMAARVVPSPVRLPSVSGARPSLGRRHLRIPVGTADAAGADGSAARRRHALAHCLGTYLGISLGARFEPLAVAHGGVLSLGFLAGACELLGLV